MVADIAANLARVRRRIELACRAAGRPSGSVQLLAVSKTFGADAIGQAMAAGQREYGENYLQEALPKIAALADHGPVWHFIGPVQSNKTAQIARHFDWVQGIEREKIARRLSEQRPESLPPLNVCVQVNISGEASKSGIAPGEAAELCRSVAGLPRLKLRGLMAIPAPVKEARDARAAYRRLRELFDGIRQAWPGLQLDTLSAGMSNDLEAAIAEGSTMVRVGTAIFGRRD